MDFMEISNKLQGKNVNTIEEARSYLSDEELLYYLNNNIFYGVHAEIEDEDVCTVAEILKIIGSKNLSVAHTSRILSACVKFVERMARFRF